MYANTYVMVMLWNVDNSLLVSGQPFQFYLPQGQQNLEDWQKSVQCFQSYNSYM